MNEIQRLRQEGLSISEIARHVQADRKTVRKYLQDPRPRAYVRKKPVSRLLDAHTAYIDERLKRGVWNAVVLLREIRERGYTGGYTVLTDYLRPLRQQARIVATRRFETPPGRQAQVDWVHVGTLHTEQGEQALYGFVMTLGHSRAMYAEVVTDNSLLTFLQMHERAFAYLGGVPEQVLYDNDGMVVVPSAWKDGQPSIQPDLQAFSEHHRYRISLCRPHRPQTKGKIERSIHYVRASFLCGREASRLSDLNDQLAHWLKTVANARVHGTTHRVVRQAWQEEKEQLGTYVPMPMRLLPQKAWRRVSSDAMVAYQGNRYSVPWHLAGQEVAVLMHDEKVCILRDDKQVAEHTLCRDKHQCIVCDAHHQEMPFGPAKSRRKNRVDIHESATGPAVEERSLAVYEAVAGEAA